MAKSDEPPRSQPTVAFDALADPEDPLVGTLLLGKWRVLALLGAGSFGTVYKVEDVKGGWVEALKVLGVDRLTGADAELGLPAGHPTDQTYELMLATDRAEVRPVAETGVAVPPAMEGIVLRLLRRNPDERFQSARELKEALEAVARGAVDASGAALRVLTAEPGAEVEVRAGTRVVARGPTPLSAEGLTPGSFKIAVRDSRYEPVKTSVTLSAGAFRDVTLVTSPRRGGLGAGLLRRPVLAAAAVAVLLVAAAGLFVRPWGRTLEAADLSALASEGRITSARVTEGGIEGRLDGGPLRGSPFRVSLPVESIPGTVGVMRAAGVDVDASLEVDRLITRAASAQALTRYYGFDGDDVRAYAERAAALDAESLEARSLLRKVAERLAWDAEAALAEGNAERAQELARACLALVPDHPSCLATPGAV